MKLRFSAIAAVLLVACFIAASSPAYASSVSTQPSPPAGAVQEPMYSVSTTGITIGPNGSALVHLSNGATVIVPISVAHRLIKDNLVNPNAGPTPDNTVYGTCGYSWVYISPDSNDSGVQGLTGFDVYSTAIGQAYYTEWAVSTQNTSFNRTQFDEWGEGVTNYWEATFYAILGLGIYDSSVVAPQGYPASVVFGTSGICYSTGPTDYGVLVS